MCRRYSQTVDWEQGIEQFSLDSIVPNISLMRRYNVAPFQLAPVIRGKSEGRHEVVMMRWGLVPFWATSTSVGRKFINAPAEKIVTRPAFKYAVRRRRCLIPATGYYEWPELNGEPHPFHIRMTDGSAFGMAGLWETWKPAEDSMELLHSFTIITTESNPLLEPIHFRMPAIVDPVNYAMWLNEDLTDVDLLAPVFEPYPASHMEAYRVGPDINGSEYDGPACIEPLEVECVSR